MAFTTTSGTVVPGYVMRAVATRLAAGDDWQAVATDHLRFLVPAGEDDLDDVMEILRAAEVANETEVA